MPAGRQALKIIPCRVDQAGRPEGQPRLGLRDRVGCRAPGRAMIECGTGIGGDRMDDSVWRNSRSNGDLRDGTACGELATQLGGLYADGRGGHRDRAPSQPAQQQAASIAVTWTSLRASPVGEGQQVGGTQRGQAAKQRSDEQVAVGDKNDPQGQDNRDDQPAKNAQQAVYSLSLSPGQPIGQAVSTCPVHPRIGVSDSVLDRPLAPPSARVRYHRTPCDGSQGAFAIGRKDDGEGSLPQLSAPSFLRTPWIREPGTVRCWTGGPAA